MRVIAGSRRSLKLIAPDGLDTRPTQDRIKETLFNVIQNEIPGCVFVDLFAGSGGIGIEALSRGAKRAYLVDSSKECETCIKKNLKTTRFEEQAVYYKADVFFAFQNQIREHVDIVYMDPPYHGGFEERLLNMLYASEHVDSDTLLILEADLNTEIDFEGFEIVKNKRYKTNQHYFFRKKDKE